MSKKVNYKQVSKFTDAYDHSCSDVWITDILNNNVDIEELRKVILNPKKYAEGGANIGFIFRKGKNNE